MANVEQTQEMIPFITALHHHSCFAQCNLAEQAVELNTQDDPFITCEISLGQHVCELVFGVNVFDLDFGVQIDSIE